MTTEADIADERRVPDRAEVAALLAEYFVAADARIADRLHAAIVALAADPSRLNPTKSAFRANSRSCFGQAWKETLSRGQSLPRMRDLVAWIAVTEAGYPAPKPYCPPQLVGRWTGGGNWRLDADGTATIDDATLARTKRWCVHRQGDPGPAGDSLWLFDEVDDERPLQIEDVGRDVLRLTLLDLDTTYELRRAR